MCREWHMLVPNFHRQRWKCSKEANSTSPLIKGSKCHLVVERQVALKVRLFFICFADWMGRAWEVSCAVGWACQVNHAKVISVLQDRRGQWGGSPAIRRSQKATAWWSSISPPTFGDGPNKTKDFPAGSLPLVHGIKGSSGGCPRSVQNQPVMRLEVLLLTQCLRQPVTPASRAEAAVIPLHSPTDSLCPPSSRAWALLLCRDTLGFRAIEFCFILCLDPTRCAQQRDLLVTLFSPAGKDPSTS